MDNSKVIAGLFVFIVIVIIWGFIYYLKKAHSIANKQVQHADLLADVQKVIKKDK